MWKCAAPAAALAVLAVVAGCGGDPPTVSVPPAEKAGAGLAAVERATLEAAGREFAEDVRAGRGASVAGRFDIGAFVREVLQGVPVTQEVWGEFRSGVEEGLSDRPGGLLADAMGQDFRFLRLVEVGGTTQMLFRVWDEDDGVNYLRGIADRPGGEGWRMVDVFSFTSGETLSESMRRTYLPLLAEGGGGGEAEAVMLTGYQDLQEVVREMDAGDFPAARRRLEAVSAKLREQRFARVLELDILSRIDGAGEDYAAALEGFKGAFPDDPSLPLMMLEYHSIRGEHEQVLQRVAELDELLGGDAFLHFLRAGALSGLGREAEAVEGLRAAIAAEPEIEELRWALVHAALPAGAYALVAETLRALRDDFEYEFSAEQLRESEEYGAFLESAEGRGFLGELREDA